MYDVSIIVITSEKADPKVPTSPIRREKPKSTVSDNHDGIN